MAKVCCVPGCPTIHDGTTSRCGTHETAARRSRESNKVYDTRGHRKGFRPAVLRRDPICVICGIAQSTDADHYPLDRDELVRRGMDPNDPAHGRGLCHSCHSKHTAATNPGGWAAR